MAFSEKVRLAARNAAGLIRAMDLASLYGDDVYESASDADKHSMERAQEFIAAFLEKTFDR